MRKSRKLHHRIFSSAYCRLTKDAEERKKPLEELAAFAESVDEVINIQEEKTKHRQNIDYDEKGWFSWTIWYWVYEKSTGLL